MTVLCYARMTALGHLAMALVLSKISGHWTGGTRTTNTTLTLGYAMPWAQGWPIGPTTGSAILVGLDEVKRRAILPGFDVDWVWRDTYCEPRRGIQMTVDMWVAVERLDGIIGPGCSSSSQPVALLAAAWGIPVVSYGATSSKLSNKAMFPTFTRTQGTKASRAPAFTQLLDTFNWNRLAIVTTPAEVYKVSSIAILEEMGRRGKKAILQVVDSTVQGTDVIHEKMADLYQVMKTLKQKARVFILAGYPLDLRNMLITAHELEMMNGDCAFITHEYVLDEMAKMHAYRPELDDVIYDGIMAIGVFYPAGQDWDHFRQKVINAFQDPRFDSMPHLASNASVSQVEVYAGDVHDSVLLWAYGVNKTLQQGHKPNDGFQVTRNIFNMQYEGITGTVAIDENGDRRQDLRVVIVQNKEKVVIMEYSGARNKLIKVYKFENETDWSGILWYGNMTIPPSDSPLCGWDNEFCNDVTSDNTVLLISVLATAAAVGLLLVIPLIFIKNYRYKSRIKSLMTDIKWDEVQICENNTSAKSVVSLGKVSNTSSKTLKVVSYKNMLAVATDLAIVPDLTDSKVLTDLQAVGDLSHENINQFIGMCLQVPNVCYLMSYSSRGTLQCIITNMDIKLSTDFKISFILDITTGMWYLHQSSVCSHGRLTSSKIVVDSRWTCKITDYGLSYVKQNYRFRSETTDKVNPSKQLWSAPELLNRKGISGQELQKCDVYSYAVILAEIFLEDLPYAKNVPYLDPEEIIDMVKAEEEPPYRPNIPNESCPEAFVSLMQRCWHNESKHRPGFNDILSDIKRIYRRKNTDLVDNMIKRLEKYTKDLEEKVAIRYMELQSEKEKVTLLLTELLPVTVAQCLVADKMAEPEMFQCVTVYFSDIVGFTAISSEGSPMDIVQLLNNMYTLFDDISRKYDVYKVGTIGDAYMVTSGVPVRNGDQHAAEVCSLALEILEAIQEFVIPHKPGQFLRMRIGIHSGPCAAGVIGVKVPRYLLVGDTVEIAARMESSGEPMRIQISQSTQSLIKESTKLLSITRGEITLKDDTEIKTFWLESKV